MVEIRPGRVCGFCSTGDRHDLCPQGVANGDGQIIYTCTCPHGIRGVRCLDCNELDFSLAPEDWVVDPLTWRCLDEAACRARRDQSRENALDALWGPERSEGAPSASEGQENPKEGRRRGLSSCLHCGESTKGGLFLPGHDSKYLATAVKTIREHPNPEGMLAATLAGWESQGISPALRAKLQRKAS